MPETSLPERMTSMRSAAELRLDEIDVPLRARRREIAGRLALAAADMVAVTAALLIVSVLPVIEARFTAWILAFIPLFALLAKAAGLYDRDQVVLHKTTLDEAPVLVAVAAIFALLVEGMQALAYNGASHPLPLWAVLICALVLARALARFLTVRLMGTERVVVIGNAQTAALVARKVAADPSLNATVIGRVGSDAGEDDQDDRLLGTPDELPAVLERHRIERAIVASTQAGGEDMADVIRLTSACGVRVAVFPRMLEVIGTSVEFDDLGGQVLLGVRGFGLTPSSRLLKRAFDVIVATLMLVLLAPVLALIALAIRLTSHGPVVFSQTRIGRHGREFRMLKFRTMVPGADEKKERGRGPERGLADVQDRGRPPHHPGRALSPPPLAGRAASAPERPAGGHEPGRPTPADRRGGSALLGLAATPLPRGPGHHRAVADPGLEQGSGQRHGRDRLPLLRELVALAGRQDHGPHDPVRSQPPQRRVPLQPPLRPR